MPHIEVVETLVETLSFRHIGVVKEEYAVGKDGMKMFIYCWAVDVYAGGACTLASLFRKAELVSVRIGDVKEPLAPGAICRRGDHQSL